MKTEKIINSIRNRISKLEEEIERRVDDMLVIEDVREKGYNAACINKSYDQVKFLGLILSDLEEM